MALGAALKGLQIGAAGAETVGHGKRYTRQQRVRGMKPPMPVPQPQPQIKMSAARALKSCLHKQAGIGSTVSEAGKKMLPLLLAGTALQATGMGLGMGARGVGGAYQRFQSERMFKELKRRYPSVKRHPKAREYFDMIVAYAPSLMRHPSAIGDFLDRQLQYPSTSVEFIKQLADLEATVSKTEASSAAAQFGTGAVGAIGAIPKTLAEGLTS